MKRQSPGKRDLLALDQYERVMARHEDLLVEAEQIRSQKHIPVTSKPRRSMLKMLLDKTGTSLISLGEWLKEQGSKRSSQEEFAYQQQQDRL